MEMEIQKVPQRVVACKSSLRQRLFFVSLLCSTPLSTLAWLSPSRTDSSWRQQFQKVENSQENNPFQSPHSSISLNRKRQQLCSRRLSQLQQQNIDMIHHRFQQQYDATANSVPQQLQHRSSWKGRFSRLLLRLRKKCTPRNCLILSIAILFVSILIIFPSKSIAASSPPPVINSVAAPGAVATPAVLVQQAASQQQLPPPLTTTPAATATTATTLRTSHQRALSQKMELTLSLRLLFASLAGGAVGWERAASHHSAGVRTMALVSLGAAAFTICSLYGFIGTKFDASRVASNVASGVGFIGAGVITTHKMQHQQHQLSLGNNNAQQLPPPISVVHGLTTAAAIWLSAAVGVASGVGLYFISGTTAMSTILILRFGRVKQTKFGERIGYVSKKRKGLLQRNTGQMLLLQQDAGVASLAENEMETYHRNGGDDHHHHESHEHDFNSLEDTHDLSTWDEELPSPPPVVGDDIAHHFSSETSSWHHADDDSSDVLAEDHNDNGDSNNNCDVIGDSMLFQEEETDEQHHKEGRVPSRIEIMEIDTTGLRTEELTHYKDMGDGRMNKEDTDLRVESRTRSSNDDSLQS